MRSKMDHINGMRMIKNKATKIFHNLVKAREIMRKEIAALTNYRPLHMADRKQSKPVPNINPHKTIRMWKFASCKAPSILFTNQLGTSVNIRLVSKDVIIVEKAIILGPVIAKKTLIKWTFFEVSQLFTLNHALRTKNQEPRSKIQDPRTKNHEA